MLDGAFMRLEGSDFINERDTVFESKGDVWSI